MVWISTGVGFAASIAGVTLAVQRRNSPWFGTGTGYVVGIAGLLTLFASLALGSLEDLLARMHDLGAADRGIEAVTGPGLGASAETIEQIIRRWTNWYDLARANFVARPSIVLWAYLLIDSILFVPAYVTLLAMLRMRTAILEPDWRGEMSPAAPAEPKPPWTDIGQAVRRVGFPIALALTDALENVLTEVGIRSPLQNSITSGDEVLVSGILAFGLRVATVLKWTFLVLVIINTIPALAAGWQYARRQGKVPTLVRALLRLRVMVFLVAAFGLIAILQLQVPDVMRRWGWREALYAGVAATGFGTISWIWSRRILSASRELTRQPKRGHLVAWAVGAGAAAVAGLVCGPRGLVIPAAALVLLAWVDGLGPSEAPTTEDPPNVGREALPKLLAITPPVFLGIGAIRALLPEAIFNHPDESWPTILVLLFAGLLPIAVAIGIWWLFGRTRLVQLSVESGSVSWVIRILAITASAYVYWRVTSAVWSFPQAVGALALSGMFFAMLAAAFGALSLWVERVPPPRALWGFGFRRTPIFGFLVVWAVLAGTVERHPYHNVRVDLELDGPAPSVEVTQALRFWDDRDKFEVPDEGGRAQIPMIFIAANGGGIKAATWTAFALDCVLEGGAAIESQRARNVCEEITPAGTTTLGNVFAMSGVSGGSVGINEYLALQLQSRLEKGEWGVQASTAEGWIRHVLGDDFVSPMLGWQLFVEAPRALLQFLPQMDRAEVLERSWERGWLPDDQKGGAAAALWEIDADNMSTPLQRGFMSLWLDHSAELPLVLLNGTTVEDGCRVIISPLATDGTDPQTKEAVSAGGAGRNCTGITRLKDDLPSGQLFAATRDARHFFCVGERVGDIRLSSAALMSARFPWVSPSGRLEFCRGRPGSIHVVDGGYLDNSGGATIEELWETVEPWVETENSLSTPSCVVPYLILIDSGYGPTPEPKSDQTRELLIPPTGWFAAKDSRTIEGRNDAALAFRRSVKGVAVHDRVATLYLRSQPAGEAPLGWTLDDTTIRALEAQLIANQEELGEIREWFTTEDACAE
jgi:hypothetical protein